METETFSHGEVARLGEASYVHARFDCDKQKELWAKYKGEAVPTVIVVDPATGETVASVVDYVGPESYAEFLRAIGPAWAKLPAAKAAAEKSPNDGDLLSALAQVYVDLRRDDDAKAAYERVCACHEPKKPLDDKARAQLAAAYRWLADAIGNAHRFAEAAAYGDKLGAIDPENKTGLLDDVQPWRALAASDKNMDDALKIVEDALKRWPESNVADFLGFLLGGIWHEKGEEKKALETWKQVAEKYPKTRWGLQAKTAVEHKH
jgi:tetratricopeptide (TPR) repeat protein